MGEELGACLPTGWHRAWGVQYPCLGDHSEVVARPRLGCKLAERVHGVGGGLPGADHRWVSPHPPPAAMQSEQKTGHYVELLGTVSPTALR